MDLARFCELDCGPAPSFLLFSAAAVCAAGNLLQNVLREHTAAAKFDALLNHFKQHVLAFLTNCCYMLHFDNERAAEKVCIRLFARTPQLCSPRSDQLALHNQPSPCVALNNRDLQHGSFSVT